MKNLQGMKNIKCSVCRKETDIMSRFFVDLSVAQTHLQNLCFNLFDVFCSVWPRSKDFIL